MYISQKIELILSDEDKSKLDYQSYLSTKLYNKLLDYAKQNIGDITKPRRITSNELYKESINIIVADEELKKIIYSSNSNVCRLLEAALKLYYDNETSFPKYKSHRLSWMSLFFSSKSNRVKIASRAVEINISSRSRVTSPNDIIQARLKYHLRKHKSIVNYRIAKTGDRYYLIISLEVDPLTYLKKTNSYIAIDFNHSNFFVAADSNGDTFEFEYFKLYEIYHKKIDAAKSKRDKNHTCKIDKADGTTFTLFSKSYMKYNRVVQKLYIKLKKDLRRLEYMIANFLIEKYDIIVVGDYTPDLSDTENKSMRRHMINFSFFTEFRTLLQQVASLHNKRVIIVNENNTTAKCFNCGDFRLKAPNERAFVCPKCHKHIYRDINSAINIGIKAKVLNKSMFNHSDLSKPKYKIFYHFHKQRLIMYKQK